MTAARQKVKTVGSESDRAKMAAEEAEDAKTKADVAFAQAQVVQTAATAKVACRLTQVVCCELAPAGFATDRRSR